MNKRDPLEESPPGLTSRRSFLDILLGATLFAWLGSMIYPVIRFLIPPKQPDLNVSSLDAGMADAFKRNTAKILRFGRKPVILVRKKGGEFKALSATCTHLDCTVQYKDDTEQIWCACHNGLYDLEGRNISGPPPKPLTPFNVTVKENKIFVTRDESA
ncbi:MAG: Rieske 2Fe-2S domain-containing protein [Candidatus Marinimicrobia bacterium]|nr:Rieske 2Fe-2S domain-containing protein [Candidatus Neomarinimicrobiota bacterium]